MNGLPATPLAPAWLVLPLAMVTLVILAGYATALQSGDVPAKRRRIRTTNTLLMMLATPLIAYAFAFVSPANARMFLLAWLAVTGLVGIMVLLAGLDAIYSMRLHREQRRAVRRALRASIGGGVQGIGGITAPDHDRS
jgi:hypothetical protein